MLCLVSWAICLKKKNVSIFLDWVAFQELCLATTVAQTWRRKASSEYSNETSISVFVLWNGCSKKHCKVHF